MNEKTKMTIHRALAELKLIDAKITKQTNEIIPSGYYQKGKLVGGYMTDEQFNAQAISNFDSVTDLIKRKSLIKTAIVSTNSKTTVRIGRAEMTIADAITNKANIVLMKNLALALRAKHAKAVGELNKNNEIVDANVHRLLEATFGKENVKVGKEDVESVRKPYLDANTFHLLDPIKVEEKIQAIEQEVALFEAEVDAALSEINAVTFIEF